MSAKRLKMAAFLVLANYVLALTVGAGFHVHAHRPSAVDRADFTSGCSHGVAELPGGCESGRAVCCVVEGTAGEGAPLVSFGSEKCPVCQFLAQKPVPGQPVRPVECSERVEHWVPAKLIRPGGNSPSTHPIRGPPAMA